MITKFSEAILVRSNGRKQRIKYKNERAVNDDNINIVLRKFKITEPEWNRLTQSFEFVDNYWEGRDEDKPVDLLLYDDQGFQVESIEDTEE